jgi:hypothetical protein
MTDIDTSAKEKLLNDFFGPRCSDFEPECAGCVAWRAFDTMRAERDGLLRVVTDNHVALCRAEEAEAKLAKAVEALKFTYSTLTEINPSNYDHDQVCEQNSASVEAILSIAAVLDELEEK